MARGAPLYRPSPRRQRPTQVGRLPSPDQIVRYDYYKRLRGIDIYPKPHMRPSSNGHSTPEDAISGRQYSSCANGSLLPSWLLN